MIEYNSTFGDYETFCTRAARIERDDLYSTLVAFKTFVPFACWTFDNSGGLRFWTVNADACTGYLYEKIPDYLNNGSSNALDLSRAWNMSVPAMRALSDAIDNLEEYEGATISHPFTRTGCVADLLKQQLACEVAHALENVASAYNALQKAIADAYETD